MEQETKTNVGDLRISEAVIVKMAQKRVCPLGVRVAQLWEQHLLRRL